VREEETIDGQWAQVTNEYQRKVDLIPELMSMVSQYQEFEKSTLELITALRSQWMEASTAEAQVDASNALDSALRSLILTYEAYPRLQSISALRDLMYTLEGTENRIAVERMRYNEDVREFNTNIKSFPNSFVAGWFDFAPRSYYEGEAGPAQPGS
jgi:LemA protein